MLSNIARTACAELASSRAPAGRDPVMGSEERKGQHIPAPQGLPRSLPEDTAPRRHAAGGLAVLLVASLLPVAFAQQTNSLAFQRAQHLQHGINTSEWFAQAPGNDYSVQRLETYATPADIALI